MRWRSGDCRTMIIRWRCLCGLTAVFLTRAVAIDYCGQVKCTKSTHTMCQYPSTAPGVACGGKGGQGITKPQQQELLVVHNKWRNYVAAGKESCAAGGLMPPAANMRLLTWSDHLAEVAQRWASQCDFNHDSCRDLPGMAVGQNLAITGSSQQQPPNFTQLAFMWYSEEVGLYSASAIEQFEFSMDTGHFTQWVWATTTKVGCGYSGYMQGSFFNHYLVCNYSPSGNAMGQPLYSRGSACSACPQGTSCGSGSPYPKLCAGAGEVSELQAGSAGMSESLDMMPTCMAPQSKACTGLSLVGLVAIVEYVLCL